MTIGEILQELIYIQFHLARGGEGGQWHINTPFECSSHSPERSLTDSNTTVRGCRMPKLALSANCDQFHVMDEARLAYATRAIVNSVKLLRAIPTGKLPRSLKGKRLIWVNTPFEG